MPQQMPLDVYRGDSYHWQITLWTDASDMPQRSGPMAPFDLSGAVAKAEIRLKPGSPVLALLACTVTQPNTVDIRLSALQSTALSGKAVWDLQLTFPDSSVKTVVAGPVIVTSDVTDSLTEIVR
jgi:hypothetical protein